MKHHNKQPLSTRLSLCSLKVILIFTVFTYFSFFEIHYRTKAVVYQNILKTIVQCPTVIMLWKS